MSKDLIQIVEENELEPTVAEKVMGHFKSFFEQAKTYEEEARAIVVTDESQKDEMKRAREIRLELKKIRVEADKVRKSQKEQYLRGGRAVDGIANVIKGVIVPIEEHLEKQEKFAEIKEMERKQKIYEERVEKLNPFVDDISLYNLKEMTDEGFEKLLESSKLAKKAQEEAEEKAEEERKAKEEEEKAEAERIRRENAELKEKEKKEREAREELEAKERERKEREEREALEAKQAEERRKSEMGKAKFLEWLKEQGYTEENKADYYFKYNEKEIVVYKLVGTYKK
jgi:hypothetical protein